MELDTRSPVIDPLSSDLVTALAASQRDLEALRAELGETHRGVLALYAELDAQAKQRRFIQTNAGEFAELLDDLLDFAKIKAGRVEILPVHLKGSSEAVET